MVSSDEDEDLRQAMALSLQNQMPETKNPISYNAERLNGEVIDLDREEELTKTQKASKENLVSDTCPDSPGGCKSFLGLNRKVMEQERLARKRKASSSLSPLRKSAKISGGQRSLSVSSALNETDSAQSIDISSARALEKSIKPGIISKSASEPTFLNGVVRKTWASGHDRHEDIKIEEVLQRDDLTLAVLSSFQWEIDWLFSKIDTKSTPVTLVMQAKEESLKRQYEEETSAIRNLRLCFPPMEGSVQCMHSKLMLLGHPSYLRVVVPTANLVPYDWGESGIMENMVFLIDLPRLQANHEKPPLNKMTSFARELIYFLEAMGLDGKIVQSILHFDFSRTEDLAFVHSIGGIHVGKEEPWRRTGYCGLGRAIRELGLANDGTLAIDFVTSSMGSLCVAFLTKLYMAAQGDDGLTEYGWRNTTLKSSKTKGSEEQQARCEALEQKMQQKTRENFRLYYPTHETVAASTGGTPSGGTICFQEKYFYDPQFPRVVLRDCKSRRAGLLMHNKVGPVS